MDCLLALIAAVHDADQIWTRFLQHQGLPRENRFIVSVLFSAPSPR